MLVLTGDVLKLLSSISLFLGALLLVAAIATSMHAHERDIPEDGFKAAQSMTASILGFERDVECVYGDDGVRSEADRSLGQDDGAMHLHWMCDDDKVALRSASGGYEAGSNAAILAEKIGPGMEFIVILIAWALGISGLYIVWERGR